MGLSYTYRSFHTNTKQYIFFSVAHQTSCKMDHLIEHRENSNKYNRKIKINLCIFIWACGIKLDIKSNIDHRNYINPQRLNQQHTTEWQLSQRINPEGNFKICRNEWKRKYNILKFMKHNKWSSKRAVYNTMCLYQHIPEISN